MLNSEISEGEKEKVFYFRNNTLVVAFQEEEEFKVIFTEEEFRSFLRDHRILYSTKKPFTKKYV
jgi:hypothetical protein